MRLTLIIITILLLVSCNPDTTIESRTTEKYVGFVDMDLGLGVYSSRTLYKNNMSYVIVHHYKGGVSFLNLTLDSLQKIKLELEIKKLSKE